MRNSLLFGCLLLLSTANAAVAEDKKPETIEIAFALRESDGDKVLSLTSGKSELPEGEQKGFALSNSGTEFPPGRHARLLGRRGYPYGVLCEFTARRRDKSLVELDTIISVLGPPVQILDEGKVFADQSMRVALDMVPGKVVKIDLPRDWFVRTLNTDQLKTKDGKIWLEITVAEKP